MPYAIVQSKGSNNGYSAGPITLTFSSSTAAGNTIVVSLTSNSASVSSVTDNKGNTYTRAVQFNTTRLAQIWYCAGISGGASHQISINLSGFAYVSLCIYEVSGLDSSPLGATGTASTASATALSATLSATPPSGNLIVAAWGSYNYPSTFTVNSGYSADYDYHLATNYNLVAFHRTADGAGNTAGASWAFACDGQLVAAEFKLPAVTTKHFLLTMGCGT